MKFHDSKYLAIGLAVFLSQSIFADRPGEICANKTKCEKPAPSTDMCQPLSCKPTCPTPPPCFERGLPTSTDCTRCMYNESAAIELKRGWDIYFTGSYLYWTATQDGMDIAASTSVNTLGVGFTQSFPSNATTLQTKTKYRPGLRAGIGMNTDKNGWVVFGEYTRLHGSTSTTATAPTPPAGSAATFGVWNNLWFPSEGNLTNTGSFLSRTASLKWTYQLDMADLQISRPYYLGGKLIIEPFAGVRGAWLLQKAKATETGVLIPTLGLVNTSQSVHAINHSWGVGPRVGMNGNWLLGAGLRLIANANGSLLYTQYTKFNFRADNIDFITSPTATPFRANRNNYKTLRPTTGMALGFGWGDYFNCRDFHFDISAAYEFNVFWNQNLLQTFGLGSGALNRMHTNNLFFHGLTASARFDF